MLQLNQTGTEHKHSVIMGCGDLGASIAVALAELGHTVHILDPHATSFEVLPQGRISDQQIIPIIGDGTLSGDLRKAGIEDAAIFIAVSGLDARNALGAQLASQVFEVPKVICRMDDPARQKMYNDLGLVAISGTTLARDMVVQATSE